VAAIASRPVSCPPLEIIKPRLADLDQSANTAHSLHELPQAPFVLGEPPFRFPLHGGDQFDRRVSASWRWANFSSRSSMSIA
jgi:hypothetical protein